MKESCQEASEVMSEKNKSTNKPYRLLVSQKVRPRGKLSKHQTLLTAAVKDRSRF